MGVSVFAQTEINFNFARMLEGVNGVASPSPGPSVEESDAICKAKANQEYVDWIRGPQDGEYPGATTAAVLIVDANDFGSVTRAHGIRHALNRIFTVHAHFIPIIDESPCTYAKSVGDALVVLCPTMHSVVALQHQLHEKMAEVAYEKGDGPPSITSGVGYGLIDVVGLEDGCVADFYGEEVNGAYQNAEELGDDGEYILTNRAYDQLVVE